MSDKPDPAPAQPAADSRGFFALPGHAVLALQGPDALAFAQAQTMNDVTTLADGQWQWNGWLTPKGRVLALFALLRLDARTVWLLLPDADPHELAARLQRFVFRSKLTIAVRADPGSNPGQVRHVSGAFQAPLAAAGAQAAGDADADVELDLGGEGGPRTLRIGREAAPEDAAALARWRAFDLEHGLPRLGPSQAEHWTPQQLSLERLRAYSVKKGCYPGQEIVARTHFLGQAKRGLALLQVAQGVAEGDKVAQDNAEIGEVISTAQAQHPLALAVLPLQRGGAPLEVGGRAAAELPLLAGLAR